MKIFKRFLTINQISQDFFLFYIQTTRYKSGILKFNFEPICHYSFNCDPYSEKDFEISRVLNPFLILFRSVKGMNITANVSLN